MDTRTAVQQYLEGVEYPANRPQLAAAAQTNDAPPDFVKILLGLGNAQFSGPEELLKRWSGCSNLRNMSRSATSLLLCRNGARNS